MAKKKKSARRNDSRGYGQTQQRKQVQNNNNATATTKTQGTKGQVQISSKTHNGLVDLLGQLDVKSSTTAAPIGTSNSETKRAMSPILGNETVGNPGSEQTKSDRFVSKLASIVTRLEEYQFKMSPNIEQVVVALGYDITLESALDWLCLHLTTSELPPLFTEGKVRDSQQQQTQVDTIEVLVASKTNATLENEEINLDKKGNVGDNHSKHHLLLQTQRKTAMNSTTQESSISKKEQEDADARKAWLLSQYQYDDDDDDYDNHDNIEDALGTEAITKSSANDNGDETAAVETTPRSVQELRLEKLQKELKELEADLNNEANNYMRSKQETKQLANQVKKLKQQVNGLQKKVDKERAKKQVEEDGANNDNNNEKVKMGDSQPNEKGTGVELGTNESVYDHDDGGGLFSMFDEEEADTTGVTNFVENVEGDCNKELQGTQKVDYSIPKDWTGTTPQKTLDEWCKNRKLPKPKYHKLPRNDGFRLVVVTETKKSKKQQKQQNQKLELELDQSIKYHFSGSIQEYLAIQALYQLESKLPLYRLFPPVFRDLWLSWVGEVEQEQEQAKKEIETSKREKLDHLLSLIAASSTSQSTTSTSKIQIVGDLKEAKNTDDTGFSEPVMDSWEDNEFAIESTPAGTSETTKKASAGTKHRYEFLKRQSSSAYKAMEKIRSELPIYLFREKVLDTIRDNPVTILCAETGAGKTTQCPQYILEDALLHDQGDELQIICTQPRRVAATSVAERVAEEIGDASVGQMIGYQIRMESKRSDKTKLLFCTTGVILRRLQEDSILKGVTHVIVDEVHERQQQIDVLLVALRRLMNTARPDLKVILMSATLDSKLFCNFFNGAPLISVPGRTFPVSSYFLEDLMDATDHVIEEGSRYAIREGRYGGEKASLWVTTRGGEKRKEVVDLVSQVDVSEVSDLYPGYKFTTRRSMDRVNEELINYDLIEDVLNLLLVRPETNDILLAPDGANLSNGSILVFLPGIGEIRSLTERLEGNRTLGNRSRFEIIPLHSSLSSRDQRKAFITSKPGCRKLILSTNIAETSVTIPDVVCVIDTGRVREVRQNKRTSIATLVTDWCSKASSKQRAGRAGRVQPGLCLKLYSSRTSKIVMKENSEPELRRVPLEEVCLSILASGFASSCMEFLRQAPQPPTEESVQAALSVLLEVGAIVIEGKTTDSTSKKSVAFTTNGIETLTPLGHHLSKLPVNVRLGKMLIYGALFNCIDKVLTVAAALSSQSPFATFVNDAKIAQAKQRVFTDSESDFMTICNVWDAYSREAASSGESGCRKFCHSNYLNHVALREIRDARWQFMDLLCTIGFLERSALSNTNRGRDGKRRKWDDSTLKSSKFNENGDKLNVIHAVICAGLYPNVARLIASSSGNSEHAELWQSQQRLFFHSSSVHGSKHQQKRITSDKWIAFHEKFATPHRISISTACYVDPFALLLFGGSVVVKHVDRKVIVDDWIEIRIAAQTGVLMRELRRQVDGILKEMIQNDSRIDIKQNKDSPSKDTTRDLTATMINGIVKLLIS